MPFKLKNPSLFHRTLAQSQSCLECKFHLTLRMERRRKRDCPYTPKIPFHNIGVCYPARNSSRREHNVCREVTDLETLKL